MTPAARPPTLFTVGYEGRSLDELVDAGVERLIDVRELPLSRRRGFSKTTLSEALREAGIEYVHVRALGNPKPNRERYWAGNVEGGAAVYRKHLNNGSRSALLELAESLGADRACLLCLESDRDHTECHRRCDRRGAAGAAARPRRQASLTGRSRAERTSPVERTKRECHANPMRPPSTMLTSSTSNAIGSNSSALSIPSHSSMSACSSCVGSASVSRRSA